VLPTFHRPPAGGNGNVNNKQVKIDIRDIRDASPIGDSGPGFYKPQSMTQQRSANMALSRPLAGRF